MSKRAGSKKEKLRAEALGITRSAYRALRGKSTSARRRAEAVDSGVSVGQQRRAQQVFTSDERVQFIKSVNIFGVSAKYLEAISGGHAWNRRIFGKFRGDTTDNKMDYRTQIGNELYKLNFQETDWSKTARSHPLLGVFEEDFLRKIRSRSVYIAADYLQVLRDWYHPAVKESDLLVEAFMLVGNFLPEVDRWSIDELGTVVQGKDRNKNTGYPWMSKKTAVISAVERRDLGVISLEAKYVLEPELLSKLIDERDAVLQELPSVIVKVLERLERIEEGSLPESINMTGLRTESTKYTQEGKNPWKQRLVWQVPYDHLLVEGLLCGGLQQAVIAGDDGFSSHYWASLVRKQRELPVGTQRILGLVKQANEWDCDCVSIDFKSFDQHVTRPLMENVVKYMSKKSALEHMERRYIMYGLLYSPLWTAWGTLRRSNGVPSGSFFTNLVDSLINASFCEAVGIAYHTEVDYVVNGDDCCLITKDNVSTRQLVEVANRFGMELEPNKQAREQTMFLFNKEVFAPSLGGSTPFLHRVLNSIMRHDQRKRVLYDLEEVSAFFSQMRRIENHPSKEAFLRWIMENTAAPGEGHRLNPENYLGLGDLPPVGRYNAPLAEQEWRPVEVYARDWFWDICTQY